LTWAWPSTTWGRPCRSAPSPFPNPSPSTPASFAIFFDRDLNLSAEALAPLDNQLEFSLGGEFWYADLLALRAGYKAGYLNQYTAGAGFKIFHLKLDYAFVPYGELGYTHRVSMSYYFGKPEVSLSVNRRLITATGFPRLRSLQLAPLAAGNRRFAAGRCG